MTLNFDDFEENSCEKTYSISNKMYFAFSSKYIA